MKVSKFLWIMVNLYLQDPLSLCLQSIFDFERIYLKDGKFGKVNHI